jgi:hypothetical protein
LIVAAGAIAVGALGQGADKPGDSSGSLSQSELRQLRPVELTLHRFVVALESGDWSRACALVKADSSGQAITTGQCEEALAQNAATAKGTTVNIDALAAGSSAGGSSTADSILQWDPQSRDTVDLDVTLTETDGQWSVSPTSEIFGY